MYLRKGAIRKTGQDGELKVFHHRGFWQCMDTYRDYKFLNDIWERGNPPWEKVVEEMSKRYWRDKNVFVTGCTGLLGSWLTKKLVEKGANVIGLIRDWVPKSNLILQDYVNKIVTVRGEIEDIFLLERSLNEYEIDTVFHLAAQTIVSTANRNPISTFETNIKGTWNLLEACRRSPTVKKVIVASSDKAYGICETLPYAEDTPLKGVILTTFPRAVPT